MEQKIQSAKIRQLKPLDCAFTDTFKMLLHTLGGDFAH